MIIGSARNDGTCPGEISKTFRLAKWAGEIFDAGGIDTDLLDLSLLTSDYRPADLSVQGLRVDGNAAVPLAVQLLSKPRARPDERLDGRDLRALGGGARRADRHAGVLVPGAERSQADDRPAGLRRRRQSRSHVDRAARTPAKAKALELAGWAYPEAPGRPRLRARRARRRRGHRSGAACAVRLARLDGTDRRRAQRALDRCIGYYEPYATSHEALDRDTACRKRCATSRGRSSRPSASCAQAGCRNPAPICGRRDPNKRRVAARRSRLTVHVAFRRTRPNSLYVLASMH